MFQYQFILRNVWFASKYQIVHVQVSVKWPEFVVREGVHPSPPPHLPGDFFVPLEKGEMMDQSQNLTQTLCLY